MQSRGVSRAQKRDRRRNLEIQVEAGAKASALNYKSATDALRAKTLEEAQKARIGASEFREAHSRLQVGAGEAGVGGDVVDVVAAQYARQNAQFQADRSINLEFAERATFTQMVRVQEEQRLGTLGALGGSIADPSAGLLVSGLAQAGSVFGAAFGTGGGSDAETLVKTTDS